MMVKSLAAGWLLLSTAAALQTCVVPSQYNCSKGKASDAAAIAEVFARCSQNSIIEFSEGVDYNVFSPITAKNLSNVVISLKGNWDLPQNVSAVQELVAAAGGSLTWLTLAGKNVQILGTPNVRSTARVIFRCPSGLTRSRSPPGGLSLMGRLGGISMPLVPPVHLTGHI